MYYGTGCNAPVAFFDGTNEETLYSAWAGLLDSRVGVSSPLTISLAGTANGINIVVSASVTATANIDASDLVIHFVLVENVDYIGGNGVTPNPYVMRQMITGGTGEPFNISNGQTMMVSKSTTFTNVTNNDSTGVVVFVQRSSTKEVYQSEYLPYRDLYTTGIAVTPVPGQFVLEQNYPNPFNPSTTIRYALPGKFHVTLTVFNTLGQQVATLVNENEEAGYHDVRFDGSGLASGVYFYRLQAGSFVQTRRLLLLK